MSDTIRLLESAKAVAENVFDREMHDSSESRMLAIQNVLLAANFCSQSYSVLVGLEESAKEIKKVPQPKILEQPKPTKLVRD